MQKQIAVAALIGTTQAGRIPMIKKNLTMDMYEGQVESVQSKFLSGEHVAIKDYLNAQYFI